MELKLEQFIDPYTIDEELEAIENMIRSLQLPPDGKKNADYMVKSFAEQYQEAIDRNIGGNPYGDATRFFSNIAAETMTEFLEDYINELDISCSVKYTGGDVSYGKPSLSYVNINDEPYVIQTTGLRQNDNVLSFTDLLKPMKLETFLEADNSKTGEAYDQYAKYLSPERMDEVLLMAKELVKSLNIFDITDGTSANALKQAGEALFDIGKGEIIIPRNQETEMAKMEQELQEAHNLAEGRSYLEPAKKVYQHLLHAKEEQSKFWETNGPFVNSACEKAFSLSETDIAKALNQKESTDALLDLVAAVDFEFGSDPKYYGVDNVKELALMLEKDGLTRDYHPPIFDGQPESFQIIVEKFEALEIAKETRVDAAQDAIWDECAAVSYDLVEDETSPKYAEFKLSVSPELEKDYLTRLDLNLPEGAEVNFYLQAESDDSGYLKAEINGEVDFTVPLNNVEEAALTYNAEVYLEKNYHGMTIQERIESQAFEADEPVSKKKEDLDISDR